MDRTVTRNDRAPSKGGMRQSPVVTAPTEALAHHVADLSFASLPRQTVERTKDLVLDHLGVSIYGTRLPWTQKVRDIVLRERGRAESTIYGSRRVPARAAALVNGAAAHAIELDDTHDESLSHPGAVIIPAAFAVAEATNRSGRDLIAAIVAGYEMQCRVGSAIGRELLNRGFHPPSTSGVYGATAAVAHLLRADAATHISALGSATSMISGTLQYTEDPVGTMIKRLHSGLAAQSGVLAASLAAEGFLGPRQAIEGRYGFARVFTGIEDLTRITADLGEKYEIDRITVKLYPCCKLFHSMLEAIGNCQVERPFRPEEVVAVEPFGPRLMIETHMEYRPLSTMAAQYSLPYTCAVALASNPTNPEAFAEDVLTRKEVLRMADLVRPVIDNDLEALFPRKMAGGIRIRLSSGETLTSTVIDSRSSPERPIGRSEVEAKFQVLTQSILSAQRRKSIVAAVAALDQSNSVLELAALLRGFGSRPATEKA